MTVSNYDEARKAIEKASDAIKSAEYNLKGGFMLATANRAYYACFYCMSALLYSKNIYAKTHQGTRMKFNELFVKPGILAHTVSDSVTMIFDYRQQADYDLDANISEDEAFDIINKTKEIYNLCKLHLLNIFDL